MIIRKETEKDYLEVENLTREAFFNVYRPGCVEHLVVHNLRNDESFIEQLSYVVEEDGKIVASIFYALGDVTKSSCEVEKVLIFGPVSVHPDFQKKGYGSKIIEYTLDLAEKLGYPAVVITGSPDYYGRFGFEPCSLYGIYYEGMPKTEPAPFFMIKVFDKEKVENLSGVYSDPKCYFVSDEDVEAFDKRFPAKEKLKKEGQIF